MNAYKQRALEHKRAAKQLEFHCFGLNAAWNIEKQIKAHIDAYKELITLAQIEDNQPAVFFIDDEVVL